MSSIDPIDLMPHDEVEETVHLSLLAKQLQYVVEKNEFYRAKLNFAGVNFSEAKNPCNLQNWPFTTKQEAIAEQLAYPPYGRLASSVTDLRRVHMTSGTTGKPFYIAFTEADVRANVVSGRRAFLCAGLNSSDTVVHCLNYCLWAGGVTDHLSLEATGATVIPFGVGHTKQLLEMIRILRPTAISCTPSYMSRLEMVLKSEFGLLPRDLKLSKGFFGGEGGLQERSVRDVIEQTWGIKAIDANYGMADVLSIFGSECEYRTGLHFHGRGLLFAELINPDTSAVLPFAQGQEGELVLTNLCREAQPLVRYRTGDMVRIISTSPCQCGRKSFRFVVVGRSDQMIVVQGINVYASAIKNVLLKHVENFSGMFEIIVEAHRPVSLPTIRAERSEYSDPENDQNSEQLLVKICKEELHFTPKVDILPYGCLPRTEGKTKYIKMVTT